MLESKESKATKGSKVRHLYSTLFKVGVLAFHGDVVEHIKALEEAASKLKIKLSIVEVRTKNDLEGLLGLIIPGGESTTLYKLCAREGMFEGMKKVPAIFGTCAGAIMLARNVLHKSEGQESLGLMDISVDRNAYGRQADSFEEFLGTELGMVKAVFIRAPKILEVGKGVKVLAEKNGEILVCEERVKGKYYLAAAFHPELTTTVFHEYFIGKLLSDSRFLGNDTNE